MGGFSGILFSAGAVIVGFFTHNNSHNYLAQKLFTANRENEKSKESAKDVKIDHNRQYAFIEYLQEVLPSFCINRSCLKQRKRDRLFSEARQRLQNELDIVQIL